MFHNPKAKNPVDRELFPGIVHHDRTQEGLTVSSIPPFHPYGSLTPIVIVPNIPGFREDARNLMIRLCDDLFRKCGADLEKRFRSSGH
jgi:hypothetical protein